MMPMMIINEHVQDLFAEHGELFAQLIDLETKLQVIEAELHELGYIA
jgi:hypothetical protein